MLAINDYGEGEERGESVR